jgi:hypothetical protein
MFPTVVAAFILTSMFVRLALQHASTTSFIVTELTCPFLAVQSFVDVLPLTLVTYNTIQCKEKRFTISQMQYKQTIRN